MARTMREYVPQRQTLPSMNSMISFSLGATFDSSNDTADMIMPDVQYAHCIAPSSRRACCTGWRRSPLASPSIVVICLPETELTRVMHERCDFPSISTVHAPHWPSPQPYLLPVRSRYSRNTVRRLVCGSTSTE